MKKDTCCLMLFLSHNTCKDTDDVPKSMICDKQVWDEVTAYAAENGCDSVLINIGNGLQFDSHPEICLDGAWSKDMLKKELERLRSLGLTPYPKLNFSTCHDAWLGIYNRMVSTPVYYEVCRNLIKEVCELFDTPEHFHLGMDEETWLNQSQNLFVSYRQFDLYWHDMKFLLDCVYENGVKPWIWSDSYWKDPEKFCEVVPKDTLVSPWYYQVFYPNYPFQHRPEGEGPERERASYRTLPENGYDILPAASNYENNSNIPETMRYMREVCLPEHDRGILLTPWVQTVQKDKFSIYECVQLAKYAKLQFVHEEG